MFTTLSVAPGVEITLLPHHPIQAAHATTMARELLANGAAVTAMLGMLTSWEEPVRLAAVRALAKVCWQVRSLLFSKLCGNKRGTHAIYHTGCYSSVLVFTDSGIEPDPRVLIQRLRALPMATPAAVVQPLALLQPTFRRASGHGVCKALLRLATWQSCWSPRTS